MNQKNTPFLSFVGIGMFVMLVVFAGLAFLLLRNIEQGETEEMDVDMIQTETISSDAAFPVIVAKAQELSEDFQIQAYTRDSRDGVWTAVVYSPKEQKYWSVQYHDGAAVNGEGVGLNTEQEQNLKGRPYFNDVQEIITSEEVYTIAKENGYPRDSAQYNILQLGGDDVTQVYQDRYVWLLHTGQDAGSEDTGIEKTVAKYYIDAKNGEVLDVVTY